MTFYFTVSKTGQTEDGDGTDGRRTRPSQGLGTDGHTTLLPVSETEIGKNNVFIKQSFIIFRQ